MEFLSRIDSWLFKPTQPHALYVWLLYSVIFCFFAVLRPPFQSPDEWDHFGRMTGIYNGVWRAQNDLVNVGNTGMTELYSAKNLGDIPFNRQRKLSTEEIEKLKRLPFLTVTPHLTETLLPCEKGWVKISTTRMDVQSEYCRCLSDETGTIRECGYFTTKAWQNPPLYYLLAADSLVLAKHFTFSPYDAFYTVRLCTATASAGLWALAFTVLARVFPITSALCLAICGIPMLSFMCSSINPDALLYPLVTLCAACFCWGLMENKRDVWKGYALSLCLALMCKMTAIFILPPLALITLFTIRKNFSQFVIFSVATLFAFAGAVFFFFGLLGTFELPTETMPDISLIKYLTTPGTYWKTYRSFWGALGWLDVEVSYWATHLLWILVIIANMMSFGTFFKQRENDDQTGQTNLGKWQAILVCWVIFVGHASSVFASEFIQFKQLGWINQGRYLLPTVAFLLLGALWRKNLISRLFIVTLTVFDIWLVNVTVYRYFEDGWNGWLKSLPFV